MAQAANWPGTLVLGGGLAGAAVAIALARSGHRVRLWERSLHPHHKICGEFLSWEGQRVLARLGLDLDALAAERIAHVRIATADRVVCGPLGFVARSVTRRRLDEAMLDLAAVAGVSVERGVVARGIDADGVIEGSHGAVRAERLMLATGKHNLRGLPRDSAGTMKDQLGFKAYLRLRPDQRAELSGHVELALFQGGYAGLQMVEQDAANLCFLVPPDRWDAAGGDFQALLTGMCRDVPLLARRLAGAVPLLDRPLAISGVPYGYVHVQAPGDPVWRLGDQAAVIPSFTGDGMSLALVSAVLAARTVLEGGSAADHAARLSRIVRRPVWRAAAVQAMLGGSARRQAAAVRAIGMAPAIIRAGAAATRLAARDVAGL